MRCLLVALLVILPLARAQNAAAGPTAAGPTTGSPTTASPTGQTIPKPPIEMETSTTTASLRGIHAVGGGVAWASGTGGTVLRTEDSGFVWQSCAMPPGAEKLDFRGVWAWDAMTAIVMSSGPGDASRLYKTTDGCVNWRLLLTNPDKDGFWDALAFDNKDRGWLLGDPVGGRIILINTSTAGTDWQQLESPGLEEPDAKVGFFAASNSSMILGWDGADGVPWIGTGSAQDRAGNWQGPFVLVGDHDCAQRSQPQDDPCLRRFRFQKQRVPIAGGSDAAGVFSVAVRYDHGGIHTAVIVGGDYKKPNESAGTAARSWVTKKGDLHWAASIKPPHGYRSAVDWDAAHNAWITAGPNGSDFSRDDGRTWQKLDDGNWNAISLPWLVGPGGRIGKLVSLGIAGPSAASSAHRKPN